MRWDLSKHAVETTTNIISYYLSLDRSLSLQFVTSESSVECTVMTRQTMNDGVRYQGLQASAIERVLALTPFVI
ncbi:hypothetical protein E4U21_007731 [Claviceps maximensis]|nr:hypothetical protein E4U21_007731 [Claviceps maximensis]